jgi:dTMP kinase
MNKFVVFEGLDGSGKSTQIRMLMEYLGRKEISCMVVHFPRTKETIIGEMIAKFLRGEFGDIKNTNPYMVALMYAQDRHDAKQLLIDSKNRHQLLIVDRYVYSNVAFQCAKIIGQDSKEALRNWILELEYGYYFLPKPDLSFYLKPPYEFIQNNLTTRRIETNREYLKDHIDIHENDLQFQKEVECEYLKLVNIDSNFKIINYYDGHTFLSPMDINKVIIQSIIDLGVYDAK